MFDIRQFIEKTWALHRNPLGPGIWHAAEEIQSAGGGAIHEFTSGEECLTWVIPDEWCVAQGRLLAPDGRLLADYRHNPLCLCSYSAPFVGEIDFEDLKPHLFSSPQAPDQTFFFDRWQYEYGPKTKWGFSLPHHLLRSLPSGRYRVDIEAEFRPGVMPVNDIILEGDRRDTILVCAHTCHPFIVSDGIADVALGLQLLDRLRRHRTRYTYRFVFGPEYFTAAAFLSRVDTSDLHGGFFLDLLSTTRPLSFSRSFGGDTLVDKATRNVFRSRAREEEVEYSYRALCGNDEMFYDGPGFNIPMVCLARQIDRDLYHTPRDNLAHCDFGSLAESLEVLERVVDIIESDTTVTKRYRGPLYLSRHLPDYYFSPQDQRNFYDMIQAIQILMDRDLSCLAIAEMLNVDFNFVRTFGAKLTERGLATETPAD